MKVDEVHISGIRGDRLAPIGALDKHLANLGLNLGGLGSLYWEAVSIIKFRLHFGIQKQTRPLLNRQHVPKAFKRSMKTKTPNGKIDVNGLIHPEVSWAKKWKEGFIRLLMLKSDYGLYDGPKERGPVKSNSNRRNYQASFSENMLMVLMANWRKRKRAHDTCTEC